MQACHATQANHGAESVFFVSGWIAENPRCWASPISPPTPLGRAPAAHWRRGRDGKREARRRRRRDATIASCRRLLLMMQASCCGKKEHNESGGGHGMALARLAARYPSDERGSERTRAIGSERPAVTAHERTIVCPPLLSPPLPPLL